MHIKVDKEINYSKPKSKFSFRATPEMGVIKHFPTDVCKAMIEMGATEVTRKKSPSKGEANAAT